MAPVSPPFDFVPQLFFISFKGHGNHRATTVYVVSCFHLLNIHNHIPYCPTLKWLEKPPPSELFWLNRHQCAAPFRNGCLCKFSTLCGLFFVLSTTWNRWFDYKTVSAYVNANLNFILTNAMLNDPRKSLANCAENFCCRHFFSFEWFNDVLKNCANTKTNGKS